MNITIIWGIIETREKKLIGGKSRGKKKTIFCKTVAEKEKKIRCKQESMDEAIKLQHCGAQRSQQ